MVVVLVVVVVDVVAVPEADSAVVIDQDAISMLFEWRLSVQEAIFLKKTRQFRSSKDIN